jgi:hypothetical protein
MSNAPLSRLRAPGPYASCHDEAFVAWVDEVCAVLEVRREQRVYGVGAAAEAFLWPLWHAGWEVGGLLTGHDTLAAARELMPSGLWTAGEPGELDPAQPWDVVIASGAFGTLPGLEYSRGVLARMVAKATVTVAVLDVRDVEGDQEPGGGLRFTRGWFLRQLGEIGITAVQVRRSRLPGREDAFDVLARL